MLLFNLNDDIGETKNLADALPEERREMEDMLENYLARVSVEIPFTLGGAL